MSIDEVTDEIEHAESGGRGSLLGLFTLTDAMAAARLYYRRSRSADVELDAESEDAEADLATAQ